MQNRLSEQLHSGTKMFKKMKMAQITMRKSKIPKSTILNWEDSPLFVLQELKISSEKKFHRQ